MALVSDPSDADFNCYVSVAEAEVIVGEALHFTQWAAASAGDKEAGLIMASMMLDQHTDWYGAVAENDQNLAWPRQEVQIYDREAGTYFPSDEIPEFLKQATVYYTEAIMTENIFANSESELEELTVDVIKLKFKEFKSVDRSVPDIVKQMVSRYGTVDTTGSAAVQLVRR